MDDARAAVGRVMGDGGHERPGVCPHVNRNDTRCATRFRLGRIEQAFAVCFGAFHSCPMYHRINRELPATVPVAAEPVPVAITITRGGERHGIDVPLRATGT